MKKISLVLLLFVGIVAATKFVAIWFDRIPPINQTTKTCVVTGASSGIGREIAREMVKRGWTVIGVARRAEKLRELALELGPSFIFYVCDVSNQEQVHQTSTQIRERQLKPTLFFLNAGSGSTEPPYQFSLQQHRDTFNTNYFGVMAWVAEWLNTVKTYGGGTFVATSSVVSLFTTPGATSYGASKAALNRSFQALRLQYHTDHIGFVLVLPGPVKTELLKASKSLPFTHQPADEARTIVNQVFNRKKCIEPSWVYAWLMRLAQWIPDALLLKIVNHDTFTLKKA